MTDPTDDAIHSGPIGTESPVRLQFSSPDRLYTVILMQDLFKQWVILQTWSSKQRSCGSIKPQPFDNLEAGLAALNAITQQFEKRGFVLVK